MLVLGLHGDFRFPHDEIRSYTGHDAAAVLVEDGEILAAIEEERLCRVKHASYFPVQAVEACLAQAGRTLDEVDRFAFPWRQDTMDAVTAHWRLTDPESYRPGGAVPYVEAAVAQHLGADATGRVRFCAHHLAHALSAVMCSDLGDCLVAVFDGSGDDKSGAVYEVREGRLHERAGFSRNQSLGELYTTLVGAIGFRRFDEYKVMGLAPHGRDLDGVADLSDCIELLPGGDYRIDLAEYTERIDDGHPLRRAGEPLRDWDKAFAAELQRLLVRAVRHVLDHHRVETGLTDLALAGGVIHNCALNGELARSGDWGRVFVQPAAHDAGAALGAALAACGAEGALGKQAPLRTMALGRDLGTDDEVGARLARWVPLLALEAVADPAAVAAAALAEDEVVGWVQGRAEFGPRALGQRSILADPRPEANRDRLNRLIKQREGFRPFAPAVPVEAAADWFEPLAAEADTDFMNFVHLVRPERRSALGAVTHVDGTARVQTVTREHAPGFWAVLNAFGAATGVPVVLNTSFNGDGEPIVDTVDDAVAGLLTLGLDLLVAGGYAVRPVAGAARGGLRPSLPFHRSLSMRPGGEHELATRASPWFDQHPVPISADAFAVLAGADGTRTLDELGADGAVLDEVWDLWRSRAVDLRP